MWPSQPAGGPPPEQQSSGVGPPPPASYYAQQQPQQQNYSNDEQDTYPDYYEGGMNPDSGALSSTINLVTSAASALFHSRGSDSLHRGGPSPLPLVPTDTHGVGHGGLPPPLVPETSMLGVTAGPGTVPPPPQQQQRSATPPAGPPPILQQQPFMAGPPPPTNVATATAPPPVYPPTAAATISPPLVAPSAHTAPPADATDTATTMIPPRPPSMPSPRGPPAVVRKHETAPGTTFAPPASPLSAAQPTIVPSSPQVTHVSMTSDRHSAPTATTPVPRHPTSRLSPRYSKPLSLPRPMTHHSPKPRVHLNLPSPRSSPKREAGSVTRRTFGGFKMPPPLQSSGMDVAKSPRTMLPPRAKDTDTTTATTTESSPGATASLVPPNQGPPIIPVMAAEEAAAPTLPTPNIPPHVPSDIARPPTSSLLTPVSPPPPAALILPTASTMAAAPPEMEVPQLDHDKSRKETAAVLKRTMEEVTRGTMETSGTLEEDAVHENMERVARNGCPQSEEKENTHESHGSMQRLPEGWSEYADPSSNQSYYVHLDGTTTWDRPLLAEEKVEEETEEEDLLSGPESALLQQEDSASPVERIVEKENAAGDDGDEDGTGFYERPMGSAFVSLPEGWQKLIDETSRAPYYYHAGDSVTTWQRPEQPAGSEPVIELPYEEQPESTVARGPLQEVSSQTVPAAPESTLPEQEQEKEGPALSGQIMGVPETGNEEYRLPPGWEMELDSSSGMPYYFHQDDRLGTGTWERPPMPRIPERNEERIKEQSEQPAAVMESDDLEAEAEETDVGAALPDGWVEHVDPSSGRPYYVNALVGTTSWNLPKVEPVTADAQGVSKNVAEPPREETAGIATCPETQVAESGPAPVGCEIAAGPDGLSGEPTVGPLLESTGGTSETEPEASINPMASSLPEGWQELIDESSGIPYYFHAGENITSWELPRQPDVDTDGDTKEDIDAPALEELRHGDKAQPEDTGGHATKESIDELAPEQTPTSSDETEGDWNFVTPHDSISENTIPDGKCDNSSMNPEEQVEKSSGAADNRESLPVESEIHSEVADDGLPTNWEEMFDPSGTPYYHNATTGDSTWERPALATESVDELQMNATNPTALETVDGATHVHGTTPEEPEAHEVDEGPSTAQNLDEVKESETAKEQISSDASLPTGWVELVDPASGNAYYLNQLNNSTTWERPFLTEVEAFKPPLTKESEAHVSEEAPHADVAGAASDDGVEEAPTKVQSTEASNKVLPPGWVELIDPTSGDSYYFFEDEGRTTWERPVVVRSPVADLSAVGSSPELTESHEEMLDDVDPEESDSPVAHDGDTGNLVEVEATTDTPKSYGEDSNELLEVEDIALNEDDGALPDGWVQHIDPTSGQPYYLRLADNLTTWEKPKQVDGVKRKRPDREAAPDSQGGSSMGLGDYTMIDHEDAESEERSAKPVESDSKMMNLPEGWTEHEDLASGRAYYFNAERDITSWDVPFEEDSRHGTIVADVRGCSRPSHAIATFGFGGRLCLWRPKFPSSVVVYRSGELLPSEPVCSAEKLKNEDGVSGPLNTSSTQAVLKYVDTCASGTDEVSKSLLWNLILIASVSRGRLRSDEGMRDPESPEVAVTELLLSNGRKENGLIADGSTATEAAARDIATSSLSTVEDLLLQGERVAAVEEALSTRNFAMALLVASMCDRNTFQYATRKYAEEVLASGSPLHTLAMLFSGQLQSPEDCSLDRTGLRPSIWRGNIGDINTSWKRHLAAIVSNRTLGWDRIVLSLGDSLLEMGNVHAAHFCFMVCGCPVTSLLHPTTRIAIVGCDHLVPMDISLLTEEGIMSFARTEAYEWAKRRGNPNAAIQSFQPFKLMYAMLLADMGLESAAALYVKSIRECANLGESISEECTPNCQTIWAMLERHTFASALSEFEARLSHRPMLNTSSRSGLGKASPAINRQGGTERKAMILAETPQRGGYARKVPIVADPSPSKPLASFVPAKIAPEDDPNASFLSAQSNLLDVTASFTVERSSGPVASRLRRKQEMKGHGEQRAAALVKTGDRTESKMYPVAAGPAAAMESNGTRSKVGSHRHAPISAPAQLVSTKQQTPSSTPKNHTRKSPASEDKPVSGPWNLGLKKRVTKWLNPNATVVDLREAMGYPYHDQKLNVWVLPGEDPLEKAKPVGPPPTSLAAPKENKPLNEGTKDDPLAAMMAPPTRAPSALRRPAVPRGRPNVRSQSFPGMPPVGPSSDPAPKFAVFMPVSAEESSTGDGA